ncbi:LysR family transcriptional regulator [Undibacterium sp. CY18W]|uniref:LysR family transcriptional regulator n=1 Tax=Undibacterium hunanense TaxID=2762292 RepID=A0ABR6ZMK6_9BURK|nr:LysR family transcriptional regulator [Undibacterium hunanense]MBC3917119.1 LysR family transcriptional regulator [Undibacterium hunanense]
MAVFDDLAAFAAVVRARSFTRAAAQIGVTQSALSQTVRSLEHRLDLKLLNRTTRSLAPTEAGEQLFRTVEPRLAEIEAELAVLGNMRGRPVGTVRITATEHAVRSIVWPRLLPWMPNYPEIKIEISSDNRFVDIVAERFDIGIRLGGDVAKNMIALRIAPDMRMVVVGSPAYFESNPPPQTPQELSEHNCIGLRLPTYGGMLAWEFKHGERVITTHVEGRLVFNRSDLMADAAVAGNGLAWLPDDMAREHLAAGRLVTTLDDWAISFPGYHLYYASRRSSSALSLVIDALRLPKPY